jgi:dethiobiotin synthetase
MKGCFVTGTDTEVGKTRVSAALLAWLGQRGLVCAGYKPVAAGLELVDGAWVNADVRALRDAASLRVGDTEVGPCQLREACAPHIAAAREGRVIDPGALVAGAQALAARVDRLVVEGVGGWCVPLAPGFDSADLAVAVGLPVVLVVGLRLGCLNHALLSAEAVRARGLVLAGWVGNRIDPRMLHVDDNLATLRDELGRRHGAPCLGIVPHLAAPHPAAVAAHLDAAALDALFLPPRA